MAQSNANTQYKGGKLPLSHQRDSTRNNLLSSPYTELTSKKSSLNASLAAVTLTRRQDNDQMDE